MANHGKLSILMITALVVNSQTLAQNDAAPSAHTLEEVVVTARKRVESLQETPVSVSAFDGMALADAGIDDAMDLQFSVPNLMLSRANFTRPSMSIRGIGNLAVGVSSDNGTGIHVNGIYLNMPRIIETEFFDVERIEVLRGPQGTLYGRNTTAGVINTITRRPGESLGGDIKVTVGNYNTRKVTGGIDLPLSDNLYQRFSGFYLERDGYTDNIYNNSDIDGRDMYSLRSSTLWHVTEDTDINLVLSYFDEDSNRARFNKQLCSKDSTGILGCLPTSLKKETTHSTATLPGKLAGFSGDYFSNSINPSDMRKVNYDFNPQYEAEESFASLEISHDFGDLLFVSLTGYQKSKFNSFMDFDATVGSEVIGENSVLVPGLGTFTSDNYFSIDQSGNDAEQISQEFRLSSDTSNPLNYTVGVFYLKFTNEDWFKVYDNVMSSLSIDNLPGIWSDNRDYDLDTWAGFGELYYDVSDDTKLTLGLRYTEETKEVKSRLVALSGLIGIPDFASNKETWEEVTGKLGISHFLDLAWTDDSMLFATLSRGYKGGGFNPPVDGGDPQPFDPEYINAVEVGIKNQLIGNTLQANLTAFYYDIDGLQIAKLTEFSSENENVDGSIQGLELETIWSPSSASRIEFNVAYLDSNIDDFQSIDPADPAQTGSSEGVINGLTGNQVLVDGNLVKGIPVDVDGNKIPSTPELSIKFAAEYSFAISDQWELTPRVDYYWQDSFYARIYNTHNDEIDEWSVIDFSVRLTDYSGTWNITAFVKNITDDDNITGQAVGTDTAGLPTNTFLLEPRTAGLSVAYSYY